MLTAGIDIGSRSSKAVILCDGKICASAINFDVHLAVAKRGLQVLEEALLKTSYNQKDLNAIVATGYGRISAPYATNTITEITCHAMGVYSFLPSVRTIIDIGGQDSKAIKLNDAGEIIDFAMNDRCAAGTGKFLEVTARALNLGLDEFSALYFKSKKPCNISSMCTVFAESEVVSLLANSIPIEDIAAGLIQAVARRVGNMARRLGIHPDIVFTGGVAKNQGVKKAMEEIFLHPFANLDFDPQLIGAYGAAILAGNYSKSKKTKNELIPLQVKSKLQRLLETRPDELVSLRQSGKKTLGYFCSYVPEEIVYAMGIIPIRLLRGGNVEASNIGNTYLTQNSCPFASSCIGLKEGHYDFYFSNMDIIADAPSCYQMKRVLEVWEKYFNTKVIHIGFPRNFYEESGIKYFTETIKKFVEELEKETKEKLNLDKLNESVALYNNIHRNQRLLYQFLKSNQITWSELIQFIYAGFILDKKVYFDLLNELIAELEKRHATPKNQPVRILITGGMLAPGDEKLINIFNDLDMDFAMDELCAGSRSIYRYVETPSIQSIARTYLSNIPCGALPYPHHDSDPRLKHIEKLIKEYNINGILYYTLRFCDAYAYKAKQIKLFCEKMNIPYLHLHSDFSTSDEGQLKTRVEAFKESILALGKG